MDLGISFKNIREGKGKSVYALSKGRAYRKTTFIRLKRGPHSHRSLFWKGYSTRWVSLCRNSLMMTVMFFILRHMNGN